MSCLTRHLKNEIRFFINQHWNRIVAMPMSRDSIRTVLVSSGVCPSNVTEDQLFGLIDEMAQENNRFSLQNLIVEQCA